MGKSQREKGKRYEREAAKLLRDLGYEARRSQQYCGKSEESSDLVTSIEGARLEIKGGYSDSDLSSQTVKDWMSTLQGECSDQERPLILWKRDRKPWLAVFLVGAMTREALWLAMQSVLDQITPSDAANCFRHCGYTPGLD